MRPEDIQRLGRFPVRGYLGSGGFSWVFEVEDETLEVRRALKLLKPEAAEGEGYRRFWREARILAAQDDPNLVRIYELARDEATGLDYYVMELLTGRDLAKLLRDEGALAASRAIGIFLGALQGLSRLHEQRPPIIHRDIKPSNLQITQEGRTKLLDLGIARAARSGDDTVGASDITTVAGFVGTVKYASPEQLRARELGPASDVFSLGLCLFEALEGRHPYADVPDLPTQSYQDVLTYYAQLDATRSALPLKFRKTPRAVQPVLRRALAIRPEERFRFAGEMHDVLARAARGEAAQSPEGVSRRPRIPVAAAATGLLIVSLAAGGVALWTLWPQDEVTESRPPQDDSTRDSKPPPAPVAPSKDQLASQQVAFEVRGRIEAEIADGRLASAKAESFRSKLARAQDSWDRKAYREAASEFDAASNLGRQILATIPEVSPEALAEAENAAQGARERARTAGAELSAAEVWNRAERTLADAKTAEQRRHGRDALAAYGEAKDAYAAAWKEAVAARQRAAAAEKTARQAKAKVGECRRLDADARSLCNDGQGRLTEGSQALATGDAPAALLHFESSADLYGRALKLAPPPPPATNEPPTLALKPGGPIDLRVGESIMLAALTSDPEGGPVRVEFIVHDPAGGRRSNKSQSHRFEPSREGQYRIEVVATDREGATARRSLIASVSERIAKRDERDQEPVAPTSDPARVLEQYAEAIESSDLDGLRVVWKMDPNSEQVFARLFSTYDRLAVSVKPLGTPVVVGRSATLRFSQSIDGIDSAGERVNLTKGPMVAELTLRADGWQITRIKK